MLNGRACCGIELGDWYSFIFLCRQLWLSSLWLLMIRQVHLEREAAHLGIEMMINSHPMWCANFHSP